MARRSGFEVRSCLLVVTILLCLPFSASAADPWGELRDSFKGKPSSPMASLPTPATERKTVSSPAQGDPWAQLQAIFLPFTEDEEETALVDQTVRRKVAGKFHAALAPYRELITEASERFNVPVEVIAAVIMVESSGNSKAAAKTSSAKGLMQTINATFAEARTVLKRQGLSIKNDPFDPRASIMAGTWYLNQMYQQVIRDRGPVLARSNLTSWRLPTEYYYAGPGHGRKRNPVVMIYAGGKQIRVDKSGYSNKVMRWARIMDGQRVG